MGLARAIARNPEDEKLHEWRVAHHVERGERNAALGAVIDCFIAAGTDPDRREARRRALETARPVLTSTEYDQLADLHDADADRGEVLAYNRNSVLSTGASGTDQLVLRGGGEPPTPLTTGMPTSAPPLPPPDLLAPNTAV